MVWTQRGNVNRFTERSPQPLQMTATTSVTITSAKAGNGHDAWRALVEQAFGLGVAAHFADAHASGGEQVVDVPAQGLVRRQMAAPTSLQIAARTARVTVKTGGKSESPETTNANAYRCRYLDQQLIASRSGVSLPGRHRKDCCAALDRSSTSARGREGKRHHRRAARAGCGST